MIAVVGVGSMGSALVDGFLAAGHAPDSISLIERNSSKVDRFADRGLRTSADMDALADADWVIVAVKPHAVGDVLKLVADHLAPTAVVISVAAGITTDAIEASLGPIPIVRAMPNTPALIGEAMTGVVAGRHVTPGQLEEACGILRAVGEVVVVAEDELDALTAISGSGPAYVFYVAEALVAAAVEQGLSAELADRLVRQTLRGAAMLLSDSEAEPAELRRRVTSKGGTTQAALEEFDSAGMKETFSKAVGAATERSRQLRGNS